MITTGDTFVGLLPTMGFLYDPAKHLYKTIVVPIVSYGVSESVRRASIIQARNLIMLAHAYCTAPPEEQISCSVACAVRHNAEVRCQCNRFSITAVSRLPV